jgi:hypothetical protein
MDQRLETAQLMARFKLCLRRSLQSSVDLQRMAQDRDYALQTLRETEDHADTEELLVLTLQLRDALFPVAMRQIDPVAARSLPLAAASDNGQTRDYKFGARSW